MATESEIKAMEPGERREFVDDRLRRASALLDVVAAAILGGAWELQKNDAEVILAAQELVDEARQVVQGGAP